MNLCHTISSLFLVLLQSLLRTGVFASLLSITAGNQNFKGHLVNASFSSVTCEDTEAVRRGRRARSEGFSAFIPES